MTELTQPHLTAPLRRAAAPDWRHRLQHHLRSAGWLGVVGLVLLPLMLLAFYQVMRASVTQAEVRHASVAAEADALWRCRLTSRRQPCEGASLARVNGAATLAASDEVTRMTAAGN